MASPFWMNNRFDSNVNTEIGAPQPSPVKITAFSLLTDADISNNNIKPVETNKQPFEKPFVNKV